MKLKSKILIAASSLLLAAGAVAPTIYLLSNNNKTNVIQSQNQSHNFVDNTKDLANSIQKSELTDFDPTTETTNWKDFYNLTSDPNAEVYKKIFTKINEKIIENDLLIMLSELSNSVSNQKIMAYIHSYSIKNNNGYWNITTNFDLYNSSKFDRYFSLKNNDVKFKLSSLQKVNINLVIEGNIHYSFSSIENRSNNGLFAGYYFDKATISGNNLSQEISNFKFDTYSRTLNVRVNGVNNEKSYIDIKNDANLELSKLTIDDIKKDVENGFDAYLNTISNLLDPAQNLLQSLVDSHRSNISAKEFLIQNANNFANIVENVYFISTKSKLNLLNTIESILSDKKLFDILSNPLVEQEVMSLLNSLSPDIAETIKTILFEANNEQEFYDLLDNLIQLLSQMLDDNTYQFLLDIVNESKTKGLISLISDNKNKLVQVIETLGLIDNNLIQVLNPILSLLDFDNKSVLSILVDLIKTRDSNNVLYLEQLFNVLSLPINLNDELLQQLIFDNANLTPDNLATTLNVFANPKSSTSNQTVVRYKEWFDAIEKNKLFNDAIYNGTDRTLNLKFNYSFVFKSDLYFNIKELITILPGNLTINGSSIPLDLIKSVAPSWIAIKANDFIDYELNFNDCLEYDVISKNNNYFLSWQTFAKSRINVNLPQTVKSLYDSSSTGTGSIIVNLVKDLFYQIYETSSYFKPYESSKLNSIKIDNYNPYLKTNEALFMNEITNEDLTAIKLDYNANTYTKDYQDEFNNKNSFLIRASSWIQKEIRIYQQVTESTYNYQALIDQYFDFQYTNTTYHISFNNSRLINQQDITLIGIKIGTIPDMDIASLTVHFPYSVYSNNGVFKNTWSISLA